jgi:phosphatidate phosphatase APP1
MALFGALARVARAAAARRAALDDLVGGLAAVVVAIEPGEMGAVATRSAPAELTLAAISTHPAPLPVGTTVVVTALRAGAAARRWRSCRCRRVMVVWRKWRASAALKLTLPIERFASLWHRFCRTPRDEAKGAAAMRGWRRLLIASLVELGRRARANRLGLKWYFDRVDPIQIVTYRGYGTPELMHLRGRVLEDRGITRRAVAGSGWRNLRDMYRRFESDEIGGARVRASFAGQQVETVADNDGYFAFRFVPQASDPAYRDWYNVPLELVAPKTPDQGPVRATGQGLVPAPQAAFGVISDIDDTIIRTGVTDLLTMMRIVLLNSAQTRVPFPGVAAFYHALRNGMPGAGPNPIFYVSNSPWNLYDLLDEFIEIHRFPAGPLLLQAWGRSRALLAGTSLPKLKLDRVRLLFESLPRSAFRPDRRQRRAGPGDLSRCGARVSRSGARGLYPPRP